MRRFGAPGACTLMFALQVLCAAPSPAQAPVAPAVDSEAAKQTEIYRSRGEQVPEGYVIDRSLLSYAFVLPAEFTRTLASLGAGDRWLDVGAGEGRAILDYATSQYDAMLQGHNGKKAKAVAMSIEDRRTRRWHETAAKLGPDQIGYLVGRRFREYSPAELGQFQLITDVVGAFSYTRYPSTFVEKALARLEPNGTLYTVLQDVHGEPGTNRPFYPDASFLTEIVKPDGSELKVCAWLKSISCVEVTCELKAAWTPPIEVYRVRKTCDAVTVPALELTHFEAGTPPERRFRLVTPAQR
jgi:SAM-dependent methyltransferase